MRVGCGSYAKDSIYLRSTDIQRTLASGQALYHGLFPPTSIPSGTVEAVEWLTMEAKNDTLANGLSGAVQSHTGVHWSTGVLHCRTARWVPNGAADDAPAWLKGAEGLA